MKLNPSPRMTPVPTQCPAFWAPHGIMRLYNRVLLYIAPEALLRVTLDPRDSIPVGVVQIYTADEHHGVAAHRTERLKAHLRTTGHRLVSTGLSYHWQYVLTPTVWRLPAEFPLQHGKGHLSGESFVAHLGEGRFWRPYSWTHATTGLLAADRPRVAQQHEATR